MDIVKTFKKAKVNYPWVMPLNIGKEWGRSGINVAIMRNYGPLGLWAIEDIRLADESMGKPPVSGMRFNDIPRGSSDWSHGQKARWSRFWLWQNWVEKKPMQACLLYSRGYRTGEIEAEMRISRGNGYPKKYILAGVKTYVDIIKMAEEKIIEAETIERINRFMNKGKI